jgi:hypothetical protein
MVGGLAGLHKEDARWHLRRIVLAAVVGALCVAPVAGARDSEKDRAVTVDGGDPVEIRTPRFELFSPQRAVLLPADNILGLDGPQTITLSAHGWGAVVRKLSVGEHTIVGDTLFADGEHLVVTHIVTVVPKHDHD